MNDVDIVYCTPSPPKERDLSAVIVRLGDNEPGFPRPLFKKLKGRKMVDIHFQQCILNHCKSFMNWTAARGETSSFSVFARTPYGPKTLQLIGHEYDVPILDVIGKYETCLKNQRARSTLPKEGGGLKDSVSNKRHLLERIDKLTKLPKKSLPKPLVMQPTQVMPASGPIENSTAQALLPPSPPRPFTNHWQDFKASVLRDLEEGRRAAAEKEKSQQALFQQIRVRASDYWSEKECQCRCCFEPRSKFCLSPEVRGECLCEPCNEASSEWRHKKISINLRSQEHQGECSDYMAPYMVHGSDECNNKAPLHYSEYHLPNDYLDSFKAILDEAILGGGKVELHSIYVRAQSEQEKNKQEWSRRFEEFQLLEGSGCFDSTVPISYDYLMKCLHPLPRLPVPEDCWSPSSYCEAVKYMTRFTEESENTVFRPCGTMVRREWVRMAIEYDGHGSEDNLVLSVKSYLRNKCFPYLHEMGFKLKAVEAVLKALHIVLVGQYSVV